MSKIHEMKGLKVVMLNVRSYFNKIKEVELAYADFDVICICKTWLTDKVSDVMVGLANYTTFRLDRITYTSKHGLRFVHICLG